MKENVSLKDLRGLLTLIEERSIKASHLSEKLWKRLISEHLVTGTRDGRSIILKASNPELVKGFTERLTGTKDLEEYLHAREEKMEGKNASRPKAAQLTNDSKAFGTDVMNGLRLNSLRPVEIVYEGKPFMLNPLPGSSFEVDEQAGLEISPDIIVVGVENYSTFMRIKDYAYLFDGSKDYLFTYRATYSKDSYGKLIDWLRRIPNSYLHFGDLDKGGLRIYIDSFRSILGERASFLIPEGYEELIKNGSTALYNQQYGQAAPDTSKDPRIKPLYDAIEKYRKCCEQEKIAMRY